MEGWLEWSTTEDTTDYTVANQPTSSDVENIEGFSGVDLKPHISNECTPVCYSCFILIRNQTK